MDSVEELLEWAQAKGVRLYGIMPKRIPGRGVGVMATRTIKPDEVILDVPTPCLRSIDTIPKPIVRKLPPDISVHGLLGADLALDTSDRFSAWNAVYPTNADLVSMPLVWPASLQALLPGPAKKLLSKQQTKLARDWAAVSSSSNAFSPQQLALVDEEKYRYAWMLVNTRTFYYVSPKLRKRAKEDRMVLQPVADLFNHASEGCNVAFNNDGFTVRAQRKYEAGDEVQICYGRHGGDFLAVEYGFVLQDNRWDEVGLDDVVLPHLSARWRERLDEVGFLGGYVLDAQTVCYRTQVALRTLCSGSVKEWRRFVDGEDDGEGNQGKVDGLLVDMLGKYRGKIAEVIRQVKRMKDGEEDQRKLLIDRWDQVGRLVDMTVARLRGAN